MTDDNIAPEIEERRAEILRNTKACLNAIIDLEKKENNGQLRTGALGQIHIQQQLFTNLTSQLMKRPFNMTRQQIEDALEQL